MGIKVVGTGSYVPENILTNGDLERMVDTNDEWITTRTGITERRITGEGEFTSDMAVQAAMRAMDMAKILPEELDLIVIATVTPDSPLPSTACVVQKKLNAKNAACFDFQAACTGFIYGIEIVTSMMKASKRYKKALLVGAETLSSIVDWSDRNTCVLFGDGAGAFVFEKTKEKEDTLIASALHADGEHFDLLMIPAGGCSIPLTEDNIKDKNQYVKMEGNKVFKLAVNSMVGSCREVLELAHLKSEDIKWLIPHQANMRIISAVGSRFGFPSEQVATNLHKYGNTSAASIILAMDELIRDGRIQKGDKILITAFGGGMTWGAAILKW